MAEYTLSLLIDTDPGIDDAVAILMALAAPQVEVVGLTTVGGNVSLARTTRNALALLNGAGRNEVPVARGAARPLEGRFSPSTEFHGPGGLSVRLPNPYDGPTDETAVDFLERTLDRRPGEISVVALGPLTNLAHLLRRDRHALRQARNVVVMGGAVDTPGNVTPLAEFNFYSDAVAAQEVLSSGTPLTLVDLAACRQVYISREQVSVLSAENDLGRLALRLVTNWFRRDPARERFEFYDPLAMALALDPAIASVRKVDLDVGTATPEDWGETSESGLPGETALADHINAARFFVLLRRLLGRDGG